MDLSVNVITEEVGRQTLKLLYDNLNNEIDTRSAGWTASDNIYFSSIGRSSPGFTVEHIEDENFYPGVVPSLINAPIENYPNCCAFALVANPVRSSDDTGEIYDIELTIEIMVKSINSELEVNSRINKTLEATHAVLIQNRSINHTVPKVGAPRISRGDVFVRRESGGTGTRWFWQGGVLTYRVDKYTYIG